jgi:hypothetical protein
VIGSGSTFVIDNQWRCWVQTRRTNKHEIHAGDSLDLLCKYAKQGKEKLVLAEMKLPGEAHEFKK